MKMMRKLMLGAACAAVLYGVWQVSQPPQIEAVHQLSGRPHLILVRHFPLTRQGKIDWWDRNQVTLKSQYGIPAPYPNGNFSVTVMEWDGNYRVDPGRDASFFEDAIDLLCFEDMSPPTNCIAKKPVMHVSSFDGERMRFAVDGPTGWATYIREPGSDELKLRR
ncbi:DUF943 family protein [Aeromonas piscicola]|uniref:DUF943 family protein n=1 Tax=Aeromonas piscicola TaxID=600645 RepID=UPI0005B3B92D|nr:DUF943 family protein [Aeromonas piscicola]